jgi:hypothetical protein
MNDALRAKTLKIRELVGSEIVGLFQSRYELGSIMLDIKEHPETYDGMSDIQLAQFFGESGKTLYAEARRIRERYNPERFAEIVNAVNPQTGARLHYKHLAILLRIEDDKESDKALDACLEAGWSTKELADYVSKKIREAQGGGRRQARSRPASFAGVLEHISANTEEWHRMYQQDWDAGRKLINSFDALPAEKLTADLATRVAEAEDQARAAAEAQAYLAADLARLKQRIDQAVSARQHGSPQATLRAAKEEGEAEEGDDSE